MVEKNKNIAISFYDAKNLDRCPWPENEEGQYSKKFLEPIIREGVTHFVDNIETQMGVLIVEDQVFPITINDSQYTNSFVCSPYTHYVSYASVVLDKLKNPFLKKTVETFLKVYESLMKQGKINKVIIVNNWLFTTNPIPKISPAALKKINSFLNGLFPNHAIVFRSITKSTCEECYDALKNNGYNLIASRYMYLLDGANDSVFKTRIFKSDLKFFQESPFTVVKSDEINDADIPKLQELYNALYIKKYSVLNPQFNPRFFRHLIKNQLLNFRIAKENDQYVGIVAYTCQDKQMISTIFGYEPGENKKGVYRYLSTILLLEAKKHQAMFNQSAGGSFYKKIRRAEGEMEYSAVYIKHLPFFRKVPWWILKALNNTFGKRYMKKY